MESPFLDWISDKRKPVLLKLLKLCDTINKYQAQAESRTHLVPWLPDSALSV